MVARISAGMQECFRFTIFLLGAVLMPSTSPLNSLRSTGQEIHVGTRSAGERIYLNDALGTGEITRGPRAPPGGGLELKLH